MLDGRDVIFYYLRKKLKRIFGDHYKYTTANYFFNDCTRATHSRYYDTLYDDSISSREHYERVVVTSGHERSIMNMIKGCCIPARYPWHLVDKVYIPVNYNDDFDWMFAVIVLQERTIHVYNSSWGSRCIKSPFEIQKMAVMLSTYLLDSGFFKKNISNRLVKA